MAWSIRDIILTFKIGHGQTCGYFGFLSIGFLIMSPGWFHWLSIIITNNLLCMKLWQKVFSSEKRAQKIFDQQNFLLSL